MLSEVIIIVVCMLAAIVLLVAEVFFIPGFAIAGIAGTACAVSGIGYAYYTDTMVGHITVIASIICFALTFWFFLRSRSFKRMELQAEVPSKVTSNLEQGIEVGDEGITVSRLASVGKAKIREKLVEVKSEEGWTDEGKRIQVTRIEDNYIWVKSINL